MTDPILRLEKIGNQTLILGDSLDVLYTLPHQSFNMLLTDPPYNLNTSKIWEEHRESQKKIKKFDETSIVNKIPVFVDIFDFLLAKNSVAYIFSSDQLLRHWIQCLEAYDFELKGILPWVKPNPPPRLRKGWRSGHEYIIHVSRGRIYASRNNSTKGYWIMDPPTRNKRRKDVLHPTEKPKRILRDIIKHHFQTNLRVLDPFMGSGTTLVVAEEFGLPGTGIEIDEDYYAVARDQVRHASKNSKIESFFAKEVV